MLFIYLSDHVISTLQFYKIKQNYSSYPIGIKQIKIYIQKHFRILTLQDQINYILSKGKNLLSIFSKILLPLKFKIIYFLLITNQGFQQPNSKTELSQEQTFIKKTFQSPRIEKKPLSEQVSPFIFFHSPPSFSIFQIMKSK
ncbi:hypothetical protein pb186bvf_017318 [Paramecium bursaria]